MKKILRFILWVIIIFVLVVFCYFFIGKGKPAEKIEWGVTFSKRPFVDFEMDWKKSYLKILDELKVKKIRLIAYWNDIEYEEGKYDFSDLDFQIKEAEKRGAEIIVVVGRRVPRWPECFEPDWIKSAQGGLPLNEAEKQEKILAFITKIITRYKNNSSIKIWQVENEPFLRTFGECSKLDKNFFDLELALVRGLDPNKPIMITESGEFSTWIGAAKRTETIGTSVYRTVYGKLGYVTYPIPAVFYQRKSNLIRLLFGKKDIVAIEVQAEPWGYKPNQSMTIAEQDMSMSFERFNGILEYVKNAGFDKAYLWGVEWWLWRKEKFNDDRFWNRAKELF